MLLTKLPCLLLLWLYAAMVTRRIDIATVLSLVDHYIYIHLQLFYNEFLEQGLFCTFSKFMVLYRIKKYKRHNSLLLSAHTVPILP